MFIVSRKNGIYIGGKRYLPVDAFGEKSGRPWINGPLGGIKYLIQCKYKDILYITEVS